MRWQKIVLLVLVITILSFAASFLFPAEYEICGPNEYTHAKECAEHYLGPFISLWIIGVLDAHNGLVTAVATIFVAGFTWTLWLTSRNQGILAQKSIDLARDDFNATHRPWIPITKTNLTVGLKWASGTAIVGLDVFCKNTGNSPAQRISLAADIFPFLLNDDIPGEMAKLQKAHCTSAARGLIEHTLFPDMRDELCISRVLVIPDSKIASLKDGDGAPATEMVPVILGSIEYYFPFGEREPHYTPFVYHLWRTDTEGDARKTFRLDGTNVEAKEMILVDLIRAGDPT